MSERTLTLDIEDNIAKITMNKPERKNALDKEMINLWVSALDECKESKEVKAIILTGAGDAFCAGGDKANLGANNKIDPLETKNHFWDHFQRVAKKTAEIEKPIIAAVNGMATGAGMDMSLHCDIRFAAKSAFFRASYAAFGLVPGNGGTYFLPRIVGASKALELFWSLLGVTLLVRLGASITAGPRFRECLVFASFFGLHRLGSQRTLEGRK